MYICLVLRVTPHIKIILHICTHTNNIPRVFPLSRVALRFGYSQMNGFACGTHIYTHHASHYIIYVRGGARASCAKRIQAFTVQ